MIYALDTNTVSFFLRENEQVKFHADNALNKGHKLLIPKVVDYEIRRGLEAKRMYKIMRKYLDFRKAIEIGIIDDAVWDKAVNIYALLSQEGKPIGDGDVLIAAFCLVNNFTLVTDNIRHFENINGLSIVNWK